MAQCEFISHVISTRSWTDRQSEFTFSWENEKELPSGVPRNFVAGAGSTNSVEDGGQRERGMWGR